MVSWDCRLGSEGFWDWAKDWDSPPDGTGVVRARPPLSGRKEQAVRNATKVRSRILGERMAKWSDGVMQYWSGGVLE